MTVEDENGIYQITEEDDKKHAVVYFLNPDGMNRFKNLFSVDLCNSELPADMDGSVSAEALADVYGVNLSYTNLTTVRGLGSVHVLDLACTNIEDISPLSHVYDLNLASCKNIKDFSHLTDNYILVLDNTNIKDVSHMGKLDSLSLINCLEIESIVGLEDVRSVDLAGCVNLTDISGLGRNDIAKVDQCSNITSIDHLKDVRIVSASFCNGLVDIGKMNCQTLNINYCFSLSSLENLHNVDTLWAMGLYLSVKPLLGKVKIHMDY